MVRVPAVGCYLMDTNPTAGMESDASPRRRSSNCYGDSGDSSCSEPFSECGSDDLSFTPAAAAGIHRLLLSCAAEASDDAVSSLVAELESLLSSLDSRWRVVMELRLLAKHNPDNRIRIAAAGAVRPLIALLAPEELFATNFHKSPRVFRLCERCIG